MRRTFIIIATIIVLAGVGVAGYFYFFNSADITVVPSEGSDLPTAGDASQPPVEDTSPPPASVPSTPTTVSARLVQISTGPVASGAVVTNVAATASSSAETIVTFIERQSGNVFSYSVSSGVLTRTSNRTVPGIQSASWLPNASLAIVRYLSGTGFETINSYALRADGSDGFFLAQDLSDIAVSAANMLTLSSGVNGSVGTLLRADGTRVSEVFTTPLSNLRLSFAGKSQYLAFAKPSATVPGAAFLVDSVGNFSRIAGPLSGLVARASPSGAWVLISFTNTSGMQMQLVDTKSGETISLPVATIADKCVWAADDSAIYCGIPVAPPSALYPDDWYQGAVSFTDRIWKIQVAGRYAQFVLDFSQETGSALDATALAIDPSNTTLVFMNKNDGSLWSYSL